MSMRKSKQRRASVAVGGNKKYQTRSRKAPDLQQAAEQDDMKRNDKLMQEAGQTTPDQTTPAVNFNSNLKSAIAPFFKGFEIGHDVRFADVFGALAALTLLSPQTKVNTQIFKADVSIGDLVPFSDLIALLAGRHQEVNYPRMAADVVFFFIFVCQSSSSATPEQLGLILMYGAAGNVPGAASALNSIRKTYLGDARPGKVMFIYIFLLCFLAATDLNIGGFVGLDLQPFVNLYMYVIRIAIGVSYFAKGASDLFPDKLQASCSLMPWSLSNTGHGL